MLRIIKYNSLKNKKLNQNIKYSSINTFDTNLTRIISLSNEYILLKEEYLNIYCLSLTNIIVINIHEQFIDDFIFLYKDSTYRFDIYHNICNNMYHIFCTSKELTNLNNYKQFLEMNDTPTEYLSLYPLYGSCIIINKKYNEINFHKFLPIRYFKTIGNGIDNNNLVYTIKMIITLINNYYKTLPPHYLNTKEVPKD